jgi:hypothetical protein
MTVQQFERRAGLCAAFLGALLIAIPATATPVACSDSLDCTLDLTQGNSSSGFGTGSFGTVHLVGNGVDTVTITINLVPGWTLVTTGFPGSIAFNDTLSSAATIGTFSSALYSGYQADLLQDQHFDGFGYFNDAVALNAPALGSGLGTLSFTVTQTGLTDVNDLATLSGMPAGDSQVYFAVNAAPDGGTPGLLGVINPDPPTVTPEPASLSLIGFGLCALGWKARRRNSNLVCKHQVQASESIE